MLGGSCRWVGPVVIALERDPRTKESSPDGNLCVEQATRNKVTYTPRATAEQFQWKAVSYVRQSMLHFIGRKAKRLPRTVKRSKEGPT